MQKPDPRRLPTPHLAEILDGIADMILVKGKKAELLWANRAFLDYYGCNLTDLLGQIDSQHSDPDNTIQYVKDDKTVVESGRTLRVKEPITDSQGHTAFFDTVKSPIFRDSEITFTVGVSRPLDEFTSKDEFEEALHERKASLRELRALISNIPLPVVMLDVHSRVISHSLAWADFWKDSHDHLTGHEISHWAEMLPFEPVIEDALRRFERVSRPEQSIHLEDGERIVNLLIQPWEMREGEVGGTIVLLEDVTKSKSYEHRLEQQAQELKGKNQDLDQFVHAASHDLKAPLRGIKNLANWLLEDLIGTLPESSELHLKELGQRVEKMENLLAGLLSYSRAGQLGTETHSLNCQELVSEVLELISAPSSFQVEVTGGEICIATYRVPLAQVLRNLIDNAIRHHDKPEGRIAIRFEKEGDWLRLEVEDDGPGIDEEFHRKVFEMFQTLDSSTSGDGVGLALIDKQIKSVGGNYQLVSGLGQGSKFVVNWPLSPRKKPI